MESLVFYRFDYAFVVYHYLDKTRFDKIQVTLKAGVRIVVGRLPFLAHMTLHLLGLHWLSAHPRRKYFIGTLAYCVVAIPLHTLPSASGGDSTSISPL